MYEDLQDIVFGYNPEKISTDYYYKNIIKYDELTNSFFVDISPELIIKLIHFYNGGDDNINFWYTKTSFDLLDFFRTLRDLSIISNLNFDFIEPIYDDKIFLESEIKINSSDFFYTKYLISIYSGKLTFTANKEKFDFFFTLFNSNKYKAYKKYIDKEIYYKIADILDKEKISISFNDFYLYSKIDTDKFKINNIRLLFMGLCTYKRIYIARFLNYIIPKIVEKNSKETLINIINTSDIFEYNEDKKFIFHEVEGIIGYIEDDDFKKNIKKQKLNELRLLKDVIYYRDKNLFENIENNKTYEIPSKYFKFMNILIENIPNRVTYDNFKENGLENISDGTYKGNLIKLLRKNLILGANEDFIEGKNKGYKLCLLDK